MPHISAQQVSRQHARILYDELLNWNMEYWRRKNNLNPTLISSQDGLSKLSGGSIIFDMSQVVSSCLCASPSSSSKCDSNFLSLANGVGSLKQIVRFPPHFEFQPSPPRVVPSCSINFIGHLESCFFNPQDHLLLCPAHIVNEC